MAGTSLVNRVAIHATASTSLPTLPAAGSNIAKSAWTTAGFETLGSRDHGSDNYDLDENAFTMTREDVWHETRAPFSDGVDEAILVSRRYTDIEITLYDIDTSLLQLGSDITVTSDAHTLTSTVTNRTVAVEINGIGIHEFPNCLVTFSNIEMGKGDNQVARATMMIKPLNASGYPAGHKYTSY